MLFYLCIYVIISMGVFMNKIKLIGIDLDGTALNSSKKLTEENIEAFKRCRENGVYVVPVTGRPYSGIYDEYKYKMNCDYTINTNGAAVIDVKSGKRIISHTISKDIFSRLIKILKRFDCYYGIFHKDFGYLREDILEHELKKYSGTPLYEYILKTRKAVENQEDFINSIEFCDNIYVIAKNTGVRDKICDCINDVNGIFFTCSDVDDVEIGGNCSKGKTLLELAEYLSIKPYEVMAIGDSGNDINMLESAGLAVAMENASDRVKEVSDYVTKSCEDSGVAYAIEKFVL